MRQLPKSKSEEETAIVSYIYCENCKSEDFNIKVTHSRFVDSFDLWVCPTCKEETVHVDI